MEPHAETPSPPVLSPKVIATQALELLTSVSARRHILKLECTKFDFGWGSTPDPLGSLQRSPDP